MAAIIGIIMAANTAQALTMSESVINMDLNFHDKLLLVEGVLDSKNQQVVVTLTGPNISANLWQKKKFWGIWINGVKKTFDDIPSFYYWAVTDDNLANRMTDWQKYIFLIGDDALTRGFYDQLNDAPASKKIYSEGLLQSLESKKLYFPEPEDIFTNKNTFYLPIVIHPETPIGIYHLTAYYIDGWHISRTERLSLLVEKKGLSSAISNFAEKNSLLYGVIAIIIAIAFGCLSAFIYNKFILPWHEKKQKQKTKQPAKKTKRKKQP
ncbi:MAG: TIGR02186 family protein [Hydrotalea sp.]|nr:TIGR02186 family protein [Hydrotalea sp.]